MIRRLSTAAVALAAVATLSACAAVPDRNAVAAVGDATLTQDDLDEILASDLAGQLLQLPPDADRYPMSAARDIIGTWITVTGAATLDLPEASDDAVIEQFGEGWSTAPEPLQELLRGITSISLSPDLDQAALIDSLADATVASRFGRWTPEQFTVVPLGQ